MVCVRVPDFNFINKHEKGVIMMSNLRQSMIRFLKQEDGPTAVEYAVMLALIVVVCIGAITALGSNANLTFTSVGAAVSSSS